MKTASTIRTLENRLFELDEDKILQLNQIDTSGSVNNVVSGLDRHCFSLMLKDDTKNVIYQLLYINGDERKLRGFLLELNLNLKERNEILFLFCKYLSQEFKNLNPFNIFNTYQKFTQTFLEKLGYYTYTDKLIEKIGGRKATLILKGPGFKGLAYTPFINEWKINPPESINKNKDKKIIEENTFVYLMQNKRNKKYKIGRSKYPFNRERTLQSEEPEIELIEKWYAPSSVEKTLHRQFKHKRTRGEWFELTDEDITDIKITMIKYTSSEQNNS